MHPLDRTFERVAALTPYLTARVGEQAGAGWLSPTALFSAGSAGLEQLVELERQRLRTSAPNVIGSAILQSYQWPLIGSAISAYLVDERVPGMAIQDSQIRLSPAGYADAIAFRTGRFFALAGDPAADHPAAIVVADRAALREQLRLGLEAHLGWVIERLGQIVGSRSRGLWLAVADRCTSTFSWFMQEQSAQVALERISAEVEPLIRAPGSPMANRLTGLIEVTSGEQSGVYFERATCCYWYKREDGGYCTTCPALPKAERLEQLRDLVAAGTRWGPAR